MPPHPPSSTLFPYTTLFRSPRFRAFSRLSCKIFRRYSSSGDSGPVGGVRSEEHTSELQSLRHLVCRLLLEKKKEELRISSVDSGILSTQKVEYVKQLQSSRC